MSRRKSNPALVIGIPVAILLVVAGIWFAFSRIPSPGKQLEGLTVPVLVSLDNPPDGSRWPADTPIHVSASVTGSSELRSVELWVDGSSFDSQQPKPGAKNFYKSWSWVPLTEGEHALLVRATSAGGQVFTSNVVHIQATAAAGFLIEAPGKGTFQTVEPFAGGGGVPAEPASSPAGEPAQDGGPNDLTFWAQSQINPDSQPPTAPTVTASAQGCTVALSIQDLSTDESGFYVYANLDGAPAFERIATLQAHAGTGTLQYDAGPQTGLVQFYASAYNTAGEAPGAPAVIRLDGAECAPVLEDTGALSYHDGRLSLPGSTQLAYFYFSTHGGPWQRVPAGHDFFRPDQGEIDLRALLVQVYGGSLPDKVDLDVWGWAGDALTHLGQLHLNTGATTLALCDDPISCVGDIQSHELVTHAVVASDNPNQIRQMHWSAVAPGITSLLWQISLQPFPENYASMPAGMTFMGSEDVSGVKPDGRASGDFAINFNTVYLYGSPSSQGPATPLDSTGQNPADLFTFAKWLDFNNTLLSYSHLFSETNPVYYIRATPMANGQPAADPSNTVVVEYHPLGPAQTPVTLPTVPTYKIEILPNTYVNETHLDPTIGVIGCSIVTGVDHDTYVAWARPALFGPRYDNLVAANAAGLGYDDWAAQQAEASYQFWLGHVGDKACPGMYQDPEDHWYTPFVEMFQEIWDTIADAINGLKTDLISGIADLIPGCGDFCRGVLTTAANAAITAYTGLPPSMPNFEDALDMGIDYAVDMAISESGMPYCDQTCHDAVSGEIKDEVHQASTNSQPQPGCPKNGNGNLYAWDANGTKWNLSPLCFPPGVQTTPVPGSMYENGAVMIKVTRIDVGASLAPVQMLNIDAQAVNAAYGDGHTSREGFWAGGNYLGYDMTYSDPLQANPYPPISVKIPQLNFGQSVTIPVAFKQNPFDPATYRYSSRVNSIQAAGYDVSYAIPDTWKWDFKHLTDSGTQVTIHAQAMCQDPYNPNGQFVTPCGDGTVQVVVP